MSADQQARQNYNDDISYLHGYLAIRGGRKEQQALNRIEANGKELAEELDLLRRERITVEQMDENVKSAMQSLEQKLVEAEMILAKRGREKCHCAPNASACGYCGERWTDKEILEELERLRKERPS